MSKVTKKIGFMVIAVLFAALTCFGLAKSVTVFAEALQENSADVLLASADENGDLGFTLVNGSEYKVRAVNKNLEKAIIPSEYNGLPVTEVAANGFMSCKFITGVYIPASVKRIGSNAFYNCKELTRVYGASKVESIASNAFYNCVKLNYFCVANSVQTLGNTVFKNCTNDIYVRMDEEDFNNISGISATALNGRAESSQVIYGTDMICEAIDAENPTDGYKLIFAQESNESITASPNAVRSYARTANEDTFVCSRTEVDENGIETLVPIRSIDSSAFDDWNGQNLIIKYDERLETGFPVNICSVAFGGLEVDTISIEVNITLNDEDNPGELSTAIFNSAQMETLNLPDTIDAIPDNTFEDCANLTTINHGTLEANNLSENIAYIGSYAFSNCTSLQKICIPSSVASMGEFVFNGWGDENSQTIQFDRLSPPVDTDDLLPWNSGIGSQIDIIYKSIEITLNNHNNQSNTTISVMYGKILPNISTAPEAPNVWNEFKGYYVADNVNSQQYYDENLNSLRIWGEEEIIGNVTQLHAVWGKKEYPISFNLDGGTFGLDGFRVTYGDFIPLLDTNNTPARTGYDFKGFFSQSNGQGTPFYDSNLEPENLRYTDISIDILYAYWTPVRYQVSLLPSEGSGGTQTVYIPYGTKEIYLHQDDSTPVTEISVPIRQHYVFDGYSKGETPYFSAVIVNGNIVARCIKNWDFAANGSLDADWKVVDYTITYSGYTGSATPSTTISISDLSGQNNSYTTPELTEFRGGRIYTWSSFTITISNLGNIVIDPSSVIATLDECYNSDTDKYEIWYPSHLYDVREKTFGRLNRIEGNYILMNDLDLSDYPNWAPLNYFSGTFDGNSHKITGMQITDIFGTVGLFAINTGTISRLTVGGTITISEPSVDYVGLICGKNLGTIERCYTLKGTSYSINSSADDIYIGGIAGYNEGVIFNVVNRAGIFGHGNIGGIVGKNVGEKTTSYILMARNEGEIYAQVKHQCNIGGIVAEVIGGRIENCTSIGAITLTNLAGDGDVTPFAGQIVGTFYRNSETLYGTQYATVQIETRGLMKCFYVGGEIGREHIQIPTNN